MTIDVDQPSFGFLENPTKKVPSSPPSQGKTFIPASFENGLDTTLVQDHAILWLRGQMKRSKQNPKKFLELQIKEVQFKRTESDPITIVRSAIVLG